MQCMHKGRAAERIWSNHSKADNQLSTTNDAQKVSGVRIEGEDL